ncbi:MAG: PepSY-associated TM helix domain-containing protein [Cytophagales bacterium]|nr:PepSY-associated TM helix domain-containing protein [Cytophagales bacterium]
MGINWRKLNNALHRDVGYFFFGMFIIYALSGIALNHIDDWDPNYIIDNKRVTVEPAKLGPSMSAAQVARLMEELNVNKKIKKHYFPNSRTLKVFLHGGALTLNIRTGHGFLETVGRRPLFYEVNYLHYNHTKSLWTWFSDIFAGGMILLAATGLFVLRGKKGFKKRGIWFVLIGILIPLLFLFIYL